MSSKFLSLVGLKEFIGQQNPVVAKEFLENTAKFFDEPLSKAELDLAVEAIFNIQTGTLAFLNRSIKQRKIFSESNIIILNIWINLIKTHSNETNFELYIENILQCCMQYIISTQVSAKEKEKSVIVLQEIFKKNLVAEYDSSDLVSKLLDVFNIKKLPGTFTCQTMKLLGIIAKDSPENISETNIILIRDILIKALEEILLNEKTYESVVMCGAMEGLCDYLVNFAPSTTDEPQICQRIYVCVKKLSNPPEYVNIKAPFRAALDVFTLHYQLFAEHIYNDFKYWHDVLLKWYSSTIYADRRIGIFAVHSFHKTLEEEFIRLKDTFDKNILIFLMNYFRSILESSESRPHETRIAIRGFGMMSLSCKMYLPEFLENILALVIQRTELISIAEDNALRDSLEHFPDYIEALTQIILQIGDIQIAQNLSITVQNIVIRLIRDFHYLSKAHTRLVANSLCSSFYNLSVIDGSLFDDILEKVILQGVIWTCSHKLQFDANLDWETNIDWKDNITYKSYMPLWESLLDESVGAVYDKPLIAKKIFNNLILSMFTILDKLNLRTKRRVFTGEDGKDKEFYFCDPNIDLCPEKPEDFQIFFNFVDFYRDIFYTKFRRINFHNWINEYCTCMIKLAVKNPLISGFLKLLESGLCTAEYLNYFTQYTHSEHETAMLQNQLTYFLKTLISKCQKVSGELQISCLQLIMKYPVQFYTEYILDLIPIFQIAFDIGKTLTWLAKLAVETLEKIYEKFTDSSDDLKIFCENVLPNLDTYLQSKGFLDDIIPEIYNYKNRKRIRKIADGGGGKFQNTTELFDVQKKILNFLGKLDPQYAVLVVAKDGQTEDLVKWHIKQNIKLTLYFSDIKPEIYLDTIVPRICHLAITSSDRKTKIAACEIVHSLVLYLLGIKKNKGTIWKKLCEKILILGSDTDTTVEQMFKPLLMQLMHFMSKYENLDNGVDILMNTLMDGISNNANCSIRDLSALCLREFLEWSIKQTTPQQLAASPASIEMILQQLKIYSFDSNGSKRIGAALAFNNLYRNLREEESICDNYFIDLLYTFCVNYKLSEEFSKTVPGDINSDLEQISLSIDHVVRVLKQRNYLFNKTSSQRKIPLLIGVNGTLKDVVIFLLFESGTKLINYRRKCLNICTTLSLHVENISSLSQFLSKYVTEDMLQQICEGTSDNCGIKARPTLNNILDLQSSPHLLVYNWLQYFLTSLDCYSWFLDDNGLSNPNILFENSKIFDAITYYFSKICWNSMYEIVESIHPDYLNETADTLLKFNIEEINKIESIKCIICVQIIDFIASILNAKCANNIPEEFWTNENGQILIKYIVQIIYEPHCLEFDFKSEEISTELPKRIKYLLRNVKLYCPNHVFVKTLMSNILTKLIDRIKELSEQVEEIINSDRVTEHQLNTSRGILFIMENFNIFEDYEKIVNAKAFLQISGERLITDLFDSIKDKVFNKDTTVNLPPDVKKFGNQLMRIAFNISNITNYFVNYIMNDNQLELRGMATKIKHGEYFFNVYKRAILEQCKKNFIEEIIPKLFNLINKENFYYIFKILQEILEFSYKYRQHDQNTLESLVTKILEYIPKILTEFTEKNDILIIVEFLTYLSKARPKSWSLISYRNFVPTLEEWILKKLKDKNIPLEQKSRIITLLPLLIGEDDFEDDNVTDALQELQRQHFPLVSAEFRRSSLEETGLKIALKSILDSMVSSKSIVILRFIIESTGADPKHILEYMIREYLRIFVQKLNVSQQIHCFKMIFEFVCKKTIEPTTRIIVLNRFLLPTIQYCCEASIISSYIDTFGILGNIIETNYSFDNSGWEVEHAITDRIVAFNLIEAFFASLPKEKYYYTNCPFISKFLPNESTPNAFLGALSKAAYYARKEVFVTDDQSAAEYFRLYQCAAYRALCSIVCNTQNQLHFYTKFLFEENYTKHEVIWSKLIKCNGIIQCIFDGQELEDYPKIKERFVSIRRLNPRTNLTDPVNSVKSSKYLQTQNVFSSSLSQDVNKIDLNYSMVRTDAEAIIQKELKSIEKFSVKLERHALNKHEVMPTLCAVIQHMHENNIIPSVPDVNIKKSYPWVVYIANAIENYYNHQNVSIFLIQLVDNCRNVFDQFAHILFKPIATVLCNVCCADTKVNFFLTDIIALLLSWTTKNLYTPTNNENELLTKLLKFMMKYAWHANKTIFKFNLELIQTMLNVWKDVIEVPYLILFDMITKGLSTSSKENECGIILTDIVLANNLIPWCENTKILFITNIFANLNNDYCAVYQPAAHVLGLILAILKRDSDNDENIFDKIELDLKMKLKNLLNKRENKKEKIFIDILYNVHKNYPEILDNFRETISYKIPSALGAIKKLYLEMLLTRLDEYDSEEIYSIIISIGIRNLLKTSEFQLIALHILNKSLSKLSINEIENLFSNIENCTESIKSEIRDVTYEILIYIVKNLNTTELGKKSETLLLKGLLDVEPEIQKRIFQYWSQNSNLSTETADRIISLISNYNTKCEQQFLGFCAQLILEPAIQNSESKSQIFKFETNDDAKLEEYTINTSSRIRTTSFLPPLFASVQQNLSAATGSFMCNFIRQTNNDEYFFEPTQDPSKISQVRPNFTLPTQNSLPFGIRPQILNRRSQKINTLDKAEEISHVDGSMDMFRRRFHKDKERINRQRALQAIDNRFQEMSGRGDLKRNQNNVILYRRYRHGDYPDLLINSLAFLLPLQGLVKRDRIIARQVFVSVFNAVLEKLGTEAHQFIVNIGAKIQNIFANCKTCDSTVFATFLEIALFKPEVFNIKPENVTIIAKACNMLTIGAIYLENRLNCDWDTNTSVRSVKSNSTICQQDQHWLDLSDIYSALAEYDIVESIFSDKIDTDSQLAQAIGLKSNGRYSEAQKLLYEVIKRERLIDHYYSYNCFYECFVELGDWSSLSRAIKNQIDDFEDLWNDEYNTNNYLPKLIESELNLILKGENNREPFLRLLEGWMVDPIRSEHLKMFFCEQLMMLHIANQDYLQARVYSENHMKRFLIEWGVISSHYKKLRQQTLLNTQKVAEIDHYAVLLLENLNEKNVNFLINKWSNCEIDRSDSLRYWNCILSYRTYITALITFDLRNMGSENQISDKLEETVFKMNIQLFNAAIYQKNTGIADRILDNLLPLQNMQRNNLYLEYEVAQIKRTFLQRIEIQENIHAIETLEQAWIRSHKTLNDVNLKKFPQLHIDVLGLNSKIGMEILKLIPNTNINSIIIENLTKLVNRSPKINLADQILDESFWSLKESTNIADNLLSTDLHSNKDKYNMKVYADAQYRLSQFCYDNYEQQTDSSFSEELQKTLIKSIFNAMKYDSKDSRQLFPCILQIPILEQDNNLHEYFKESSSDVPDWLFLSWIPQILSQIKLGFPSYLDDIIQRIAKAYPNALIYPFNVWFENAKLIDGERRQDAICQIRKEIQNCIEYLRNPLTEKFIEVCKSLCLPQIQLSAIINPLILNLREISKEEYNENIQNIIDIIEKCQKPDIYGSEFRKILPYKTIFITLKLCDLHEEMAFINNKLISILDEIKNINIPKEIRIENLSPWLSKFQWCTEEEYLELPGQYTSDKRPFLENHIKIFKFGETVEIFQSQRWPMKIKIYGSDAKCYDFLMKFGEDLKQDQRIQQILNLMSIKLNEDQNCRNHNLLIRTYKVIPITSDFGMLSWVGDTTTMRTFIYNSFLRRESNCQYIWKKNITNYQQFLGKPSIKLRTSNKSYIYGKAVATYTRENFIQNFRALENNIDLNIIKYALIDISISPESFFVLRNNYATSLAAMNIAHWILGIGDRHLENILINIKTGNLIGIDFNCVFGSGTFLPIPEMLPFRLTPHFVYAMNPMGTSGILFKCMEHTLRVFRNSKKILLSCMEVFVREPTINWLPKIKPINDDDNENPEFDWKPKDRINMAICKLAGCNPMQLFVKELKAGRGDMNPEFTEGYVKILHGNEQFSIRRQLAETNLTVEEQVKCLIDMATDPAILGCSWEGYLPWI